MPFRARRPIMFAVVGDSGAGKRTLARGCAELLGPTRVTPLCLDDYHRLDRAGRATAGLTALHPDANHLALMGQHARLLRQGETIFKPTYDHAHGTFGAPEFVRPAPIVLATGLHALYTPELRALWDVSVFVDPDPALRDAWKRRRDTARRGYDSAAVERELEARRADAAAYIAPQRDRADLVIAFRAPADGRLRDDAQLDVHLRIAHPVPLPDLEELLAGEAADALRVERRSDGVTHLAIDGALDACTAERIEAGLHRQIAPAGPLHVERLGRFQDAQGERRSHTLALTQLLLTYYLVQASALAEQTEGVGEPALA
ncbi:MAG: phosphoribulokinase [Gemmatimonadaceae bacterium]|nr:phosphoribulokinase [Gemmatimonadaceae bacterium]